MSKFKKMSLVRACPLIIQSFVEIIVVKVDATAPLLSRYQLMPAYVIWWELGQVNRVEASVSDRQSILFLRAKVHFMLHVFLPDWQSCPSCHELQIVGLLFLGEGSKHPPEALDVHVVSIGIQNCWKSLQSRRGCTVKYKRTMWARSLRGHNERDLKVSRPGYMIIKCIR